MQDLKCAVGDLEAGEGGVRKYMHMIHKLHMIHTSIYISVHRWRSVRVRVRVRVRVCVYL